MRIKLEFINHKLPTTTLAMWMNISNNLEPLMLFTPPEIILWAFDLNLKYVLTENINRRIVAEYIDNHCTDSSISMNLDTHYL